MRKRWLALTLGLIGMALPAPAHAAVPVNVTRPAITGGDSSLYPGSVLTETPAVWNGAPTSVAIQWQACRGDATSVCSSIAGATGQTYTIQLSDVGAVIRTQEVASNADGASLPAPGVNGTTQVLPPPRPPLPPPPASVTRPVISGHTVVGATLKSTPGTWSGAEPITLAYEWMLCRPVCTAIPGATAPALKLTADEVGGAILLMVTASNAGGSTYAYSTGVSTPVGFSVHDLLLQAITPAGKPPTIGRLLKRGRYAVRFDAPHPAVVQIKWTATRTVHGKRRKILVAGATEIVLGPALLNLELTPAGIALLEHARRVNITATATFAVGKRITASATVGFVLTRA
jgi:hypothetical protein